jgi:NAD-dependent oxidoreductase involved in siderophore biosynthesis
LATTSNSHYSISIALCRASTITYTFESCHTSTCTFVDSCCFVATTFSSLAFLCIVYTSIKCCSTTSSSFNSSMNTRSTNVAPSPIYFFTCQHRLLLCKTQL